MGDIAGGVCYVTANGRRLEIGTSVSYSVSDVERTASRGLSGRLKITKAYVPPFIEVELTTYGETVLQDIADMENVTVQLECANGKSFILTKAHQVGVMEADAAEGTSNARFEGETMREA